MKSRPACYNMHVPSSLSSIQICPTSFCRPRRRSSRATTRSRGTTSGRSARCSPTLTTTPSSSSKVKTHLPIHSKICRLLSFAAPGPERHCVTVATAQVSGILQNRASLQVGTATVVSPARLPGRNRGGRSVV